MRMATATATRALERDPLEARNLADPEIPRLAANWYAVFTVPRHEKTVLRHLETCRIEAFLPTYEVSRLWKNRQKVKLAVPLFPCYLFAKICNLDARKVRQSPGVLQLVGNQRGPLPVPDSAIALLRAGVAERTIEPCREFAVGERVRVRKGPMQGVEGVLIRKDNGWRFVLSIDSINQRAAIKMEAENLEPIPAPLAEKACG